MNEAERFGDQMLVAYSAVRQRGIIAGIAGKLEPECREGAECFYSTKSMRRQYSAWLGSRHKVSFDGNKVMLDGIDR
jgi:hypothetical protein